MLRGMWDLPGPGIEPMFPALAGRFLTTAPPGKSPRMFIYIYINICSFSDSFPLLVGTIEYSSLCQFVVLTGEKLNATLLRLGKRKGCLLSLVLFLIVWKVLACAARQEKEIKDTLIAVEEVKLSLFTGEDSFYLISKLIIKIQ